MNFEEKIEGLSTCQSSAVFSTILLIGSARSRRHCMEYTMWVRFRRIPVDNFFVDSKSFPLEAIGIWKKILTDRTGSESSKFFWQPEMASLPVLRHIGSKARPIQSFRSVDLPCDTLILVFIMTCLINCKSHWRLAQVKGVDRPNTTHKLVIVHVIRDLIVLL